MAGLEGTVKTPLGTIQKKTALTLAAVGAALAAIVVWREKKVATSTTTSSATGDIDPATGYVYGTPEDVAALAAQGTSLGGTVSGTTSVGGSSSIPTGGITGTTGFASNGEWVQAVEQYMQDHNLVADPTQLSVALGRYITGAFVDPDKDANLYSLIQQSISVEGFPPVSGPHGFPPAINTHPGTTTPPVTTPGSTTPPPKPPSTLPKRRYVVVAPFVTGHIVWNATLSGIAERSHRTVSQLASWNGISNPNVIGTGKHIWIDPATGFSGSVEWKG